MVADAHDAVRLAEGVTTTFESVEETVAGYAIANPPYTYVDENAVRVVLFTPSDAR
jgi:hypothetical protein